MSRNVQRLARRSTDLTWKPWQFYTSVGTSTAAWTTSTKLEAEDAFTHVRLIALNSGPTAIPALKAVVGVTETAATDTADNKFQLIVDAAAVTTKDANVGGSGWHTVTWGGYDSTIVPAGPPIGNANLDSGYVASDWIPLDSISRADGGTRPLLMIRCYTDGALGAWSYFSDSGLSNLRTAYAAARNRILYLGQNTTQDGTVTMDATFSDSTICRPFAIQFRYSTPGHCVLLAGDSITDCGFFITDSISTWGYRAAKSVCNTVGIPIEVVNTAAGSSTTPTFYAEALAALDVYEPTVAIYSAFSVNDTNSDANVTMQLATAQAFCDACAARDIPVLLWTPQPKDSLDATQDARRLTARQNILGLRGRNGMTYVVDTEPHLGDSSSPRNWRSGYSGDGTHPNDTGTEALASLMMAELRKIVAQTGR